MKNVQIRKTGSFAVEDENGKCHTVAIYTEVHIIKMFSGEVQESPGTISYKMPNGNHLNPLADGEFLEVATGKILRRP